MAVANPPVIAGAGPVGLSLALDLATHGVRTLLLEADEALSSHSKAPGIHARTLEIFRAWGVADRAIAAGTFLKRVQVWLAGEDHPRATLDLSPLARLTAYPGILILPQDRTEAILAERLAELGMAEIRFGHRLTGFTQDPDRVVVRVASPNGAYDVETPYLVGCDGAHSTVRGLLGWELEGTTYPTRIMLADATSRMGEMTCLGRALLCNLARSSRRFALNPSFGASSGPFRPRKPRRLSSGARESRLALPRCSDRGPMNWCGPAPSTSIAVPAPIFGMVGSFWRAMPPT